MLATQAATVWAATGWVRWVACLKLPAGLSDPHRLVLHFETPRFSVQRCQTRSRMELAEAEASAPSLDSEEAWKLVLSQILVAKRLRPSA